MLYRIVTGVFALLIAAAAIAVPVMLTEAGTSTSTATSREVSGSFQYTDPSTGDFYYGNVFASIDEYTSRTQDNGGGGGSQRPGKGNSQHTGGGGGTVTSKSTSISAYFDRYASDGTYLGSGNGFLSDANVTIAGDLSSGRAIGSFTGEFYPAFGDEYDVALTLDLTFTATGPLVTSRDRYVQHIKSPRQSFSSFTTIERRPAQATGTFAVQGLSGAGTLNLASSGSYYAEIATYDNKSRSQN